MFDKVVWPVSLRESPSRIEGVIQLLKHFSTKKVYLFHVGEQEDAKQAAPWKGLSGLKNQINEAGFEVEHGFRGGHLATTVCKYAEEQKVDLIILSWKTKTIVKRALIGSPVRDIIRLANLPVAVYRGGKWGKSQAEVLEKIMYATDFEDTDQTVMPYLKAPGLRADALYLLNVGGRAPDPVAEKKRLAQVEENLQRLGDECADNFQHIEKITARGSPHKQILYKARLEAIDLIIAGKHDKPNVFSSLLGSVAEHLPHRAPCSILIIPREARLIRPPDDKDGVQNAAPKSQTS